MKPSTFFPSFLTLLLVLSITNASSSLVDSNSVYETFLKCFTNGKNPSDKVSGLVYDRTNKNYNTILQSYIRNRRFNTSSTPKPLIVVTPTLESHVQAAVICARDNNLHVKIRSGGHDYDGLSYVSSDDFIIIDLFSIKSININIEDETAWVEAGASLGELYYAISQKSKVHAFPAGICSTLGIGGHFTGGGYSPLTRKYGLSVDNILDAKIVDVNGKVLDRKSMGEDLFWAIRGGGGASFGVILAYKIKLVPVPEKITVFKIIRTIEQNATNLVFQWQSVAPKIDSNLLMRVVVQPIPSTANKGQNTVATIISGGFLGNADTLVALLQKQFPALGLKKENCTEVSWIQSVLWWDVLGNDTTSEALLNRTTRYSKFFKSKVDLVEKPIPKATLDSLFNKILQGKSSVAFTPYGGRMDEIPASSTPFPHRAGNLFMIQYLISWDEEDPEVEKNNLAEIRGLYDFLTQFVSKNPRRAYLNYRDVDIGTIANNNFDEGKIFGLKLFSDNFARLVKVKTAVDPQNFFRHEQSIPTLPKKS